MLGVDVQVQIAPGNLAFPIVGLADKAVGESRERVRAALRALGLALPPQRITVNLSPADLAKEGSHFDLPIALGLLAAWACSRRESWPARRAGRAGARRLARPVPGVLPAAVVRLAHGQRPDLPGGAAAARRPGRASRSRSSPRRRCWR